jgi:hypothetical protein
MLHFVSIIPRHRVDVRELEVGYPSMTSMHRTTCWSIHLPSTQIHHRILRLVMPCRPLRKQGLFPCCDSFPSSQRTSVATIRSASSSIIGFAFLFGFFFFFPALEDLATTSLSVSSSYSMTVFLFKFGVKPSCSWRFASLKRLG